MTRHHRNLALHHLTVLTVLSTTVLPGAAAIEDLDAGDVPPECALACAPIAQLTERCEAAAEQQFGSVAVGRRWTTGKQRRQKGMKRSLQRMLEKSLSRRQEADGGEDEESDDSDSDDSDDSNDNDDDEEEEEKEKEEEEEEENENRLASGNVAETEGNEDAATEANQEATGEAMRACVCGERGFDVAAVAFGCATCVAQNVTAVDAAEGEQHVVECCLFFEKKSCN
ncbi:hypothetical protein LY78DRAFT_722178 [Colletotrichum sublineola]|nr:hypothetical protein LY78DRAFT_722178 [Colletotrichum sublineola]